MGYSPLAGAKKSKKKSDEASKADKPDPFLEMMGLDSELAGEWLDTHAMQMGHLPSFTLRSSSSSARPKPSVPNGRGRGGGGKGRGSQHGSGGSSTVPASSEAGLFGWSSSHKASFVGRKHEPIVSLALVGAAQGSTSWSSYGGGVPDPGERSCV